MEKDNATPRKVFGGMTQLWNRPRRSRKDLLLDIQPRSLEHLQMFVSPEWLREHVVLKPASVSLRLTMAEVIDLIQNVCRQQGEGVAELYSELVMQTRKEIIARTGLTEENVIDDGYLQVIFDPSWGRLQEGEEQISC